MNGISNTYRTLGVEIKTRAADISIAILSMAAFAILTTEFIIIGLMPALARDLHISIPVAGQLVTAFAVTVVAGNQDTHRINLPNKVLHGERSNNKREN